MKYPTQRKRADYGILVCGDCGETAPKRGAVQRYCSKCSEVRDIARKKLHAETRGKALFNEKRAQWASNGTEISAGEKLSLMRAMPKPPDLIWHHRVAVPFSWAGSKNHLFATTARGHTFMRDESRYYRAILTDKLRNGMADQPVVQNKLWIDIFVQKPNHRGDAANFLDMVCDAVKDAIPLDDRWYSIRSIDWQIVKSDPMLYVGIGQDTIENVQACSTCGRLLPFDMFQKNRSTASGVGRVCRECQSVKSARTRQAKRTSIPEKGLFDD
jgi:hypothetical protein